MQLTIDEEELRALTEVLSNYVPDLRMQIADTENFEFRQALKRHENVLKELLARLELAAVGQEADAPRPA
jgi:hypothetical protein